MSVDSTRERVLERAAVHGIIVPEQILQPLAVYFDLLQRWNLKINLTALGDTDRAIDRLLIEPLAAVPHLPSGVRLLDVGSGGGSPAIPLALGLSASRLCMVESRLRKTTFLREAVRQLALSAVVETQRIETIADLPAFQDCWDVISARAVRIDRHLTVQLARLLAPAGQLALFVSTQPALPGFLITGVFPLPGVASSLVVATRS